MTMAIDHRILTPQIISRQQEFDGTEQNVITNSANFASQSWTLSGDVRLDAFDNNNETIWSQQDGTGFGRSWLYVDTATQKWQSFIGGTAKIFDTNIGQAAVNTWYSFALVYAHDTNTLSLSIDGDTDIKTSVTVESANGNFVIGAAKTSAHLHHSTEHSAGCVLTIRNTTTGNLYWFDFLEQTCQQQLLDT